MFCPNDLVKLFKSSSLYKDVPEDFQVGMAFSVRIITDMHPNALACMCLHQFKKIKSNEKSFGK